MASSAVSRRRWVASVLLSIVLVLPPHACAQNDKLPKLETEDIEDSDLAFEVAWHTFAVGQFPQIPALKTGGAGPCYVLTFYDSDKKVGLMAHLDTWTDLPKSFIEIEKALKEYDIDIAIKASPEEPSSDQKFGLVGGDRGDRYSFAQSAEIISLLKKYSLPIETKLFEGIIENIWLDLDTGTHYSYIPKSADGWLNSKAKKLGRRYIRNGKLRPLVRLFRKNSRR